MPKLTFRQYYKLLHRQRVLAERRDPMYTKNRWAKFFTGLMTAFFLCYFIFLTVILSLTANEIRTLTTLEFFMGISPFILLVDFFTRLGLLQTPAQLVRPYVLLPIPNYTCINCLVIDSLLSAFNLIWLTIILPYSIMSVVFAYGFWAALSLTLLFMLAVLANSQWYAIVRTLVIKSPLWWILPIVVYAIMALPFIIGGGDCFLHFYGSLGTELEHGNILPHLLVLAILAALIAVNRRIQYKAIWDEIRKDAPKKLGHVSKFHFLERFGVMGEYIKLELKSIMRNKNPRKSFISALTVLIVFTIITCVSTVYDDSFMTTFLCIYNFVVLGDVLLVKIMGFEANYIDLLMVHQENIYKLLLAKYYFYLALLLLPFVMMLPLVFLGKWSLLMVVSYGIFTGGFQYFLLMQLAVYNKQKLPLNETQTTKGGIEINYVGFLVEMASFILPMVFVSFMETLFSTELAWIIMLAIGLMFLATHKFWIKNIYHRMMARKYDHLEAFHS